MDLKILSQDIDIPYTADTIREIEFVPLFYIVDLLLDKICSDFKLEQLGS